MKKLLLLILLSGCAYFQSVPENQKVFTEGEWVLVIEGDSTYVYHTDSVKWVK